MVSTPWQGWLAEIVFTLFFFLLRLKPQNSVFRFCGPLFRDLLDNFSQKEARAHIINQSTTSSEKWRMINTLWSSGKWSSQAATITDQLEWFAFFIVGFSRLWGTCSLKTPLELSCTWVTRIDMTFGSSGKEVPDISGHHGCTTMV